MQELFERIEDSKEDFDTYIEVSMVEIYNELIRDLLSDGFPSCPTGGLRLLENEKERVTVDKVSLRRPRSVEEVMELVLLGNQRRSTSFTESNSVSSRSHAVLQINVGRNNRGHDVDLKEEIVRQCMSSATLSIIDLAGSERAAATRNMGERMKEGANINKSLLALSSCISALCQAPSRGVKPHVPYRNSKLTRMLKFSLGGNCRTVMIVCVSPSSKDIEDSHNTLAWADKAKNVSTKISQNTAGVHVSAAQYVRTIALQDQKIKILEAKLETGGSTTSAFQLKKRELARSDARQALNHMRTEVDGMLPMIAEGATSRAGWDGAELRSAALKRRIEEVESDTSGRPAEEIGREKRYLETLINQQDNAFRFNPAIQSAVQCEAAKADIAEKLLKATEERTFGDAFEASELDNVRLTVANHRDRVAKSVAAAREKGYREVAQQQADGFAQAAASLHRFAAGLQAETDVLSGIAQSTDDLGDLHASIERLRALGAASDLALASLFGASSSSAATLPPLPQPSRDSAPLGQPSRRHQPAVNLPSDPFGASAALRANPAARRLLNLKKPPGSPSRAQRVASPRKQALRPNLTAIRRPTQTKRSIQWRDEAGKGEIDDSASAPAARVFPTSSSSELDPVSTSDTSGDWDDEDEEPAKPESRNTALPLARRAPGPPAPSLPVTASAPAMGPPIPEWKKNRLLLGKMMGSLGTVGEEKACQSSPESEPSQPKLGLMGPPARQSRPGPLLERQQNSTLTSASAAPSGSGSTLFKPTAASASRSVNGSVSLFAALNIQNPSQRSTSPSRRTSSVGRAPSSASKAARRTSNAGPYRRGRGSMLPTPTTTSLFESFSPTLLPAPLIPHTGPSALAGGARRMFQDQSGTISPKNNTRRQSLLGGPRPSVSLNFGMGSGASTLPRGPSGLASRPSISKLSVFGGASSMNVAGLAGAGGSTSRASWR